MLLLLGTVVALVVAPVGYCDCDGCCCCWVLWSLWLLLVLANAVVMAVAVIDNPINRIGSLTD
jgi:hypothetical protein